MNATTGLGHRALGPNLSAHQRELAADLDHLGFQVTEDNVLHIRNVLLGAAERLYGVLDGQARHISVGPPGGDPISTRWATSTNKKLISLLAECRAHADAFKKAGDDLARVARSYGLTEQAVSDSFGKFQRENQASWNQQSEQNNALAGLPRVFREIVDPVPSTRPSPRTWDDLIRGDLP